MAIGKHGALHFYQKCLQLQLPERERQRAQYATAEDDTKRGDVALGRHLQPCPGYTRQRMGSQILIASAPPGSNRYRNPAGHITQWNGCFLRSYPSTQRQHTKVAK